MYGYIFFPMISLNAKVFSPKDLMSAASSEEIAGTMELDSISDRVWQIQACSAKTGDGLQEGMEWLVGNCKKG